MAFRLAWQSLARLVGFPIRPTVRNRPTNALQSGMAFRLADPNPPPSAAKAPPSPPTPRISPVAGPGRGQRVQGLDQVDALGQPVDGHPGLDRLLDLPVLRVYAPHVEKRCAESGGIADGPLDFERALQVAQGGLVVALDYLFSICAVMVCR